MENEIIWHASDLLGNLRSIDRPAPTDEDITNMINSFLNETVKNFLE